MTEDLAARVQRLEDLEAINQLFIDYGRHLDAGRFEEYGALFAEDGELLVGPMGRAKGPAQITEMMSAALASQVGDSFHIISSPMIDLDGDRATSSVMWTVAKRGEDGMAEVQMVGRHEDELIRTDEGWRFKKRRGLVDLPSVFPKGQVSAMTTSEQFSEIPEAKS